MLDDCGVCCNGTTGVICNSEKDACGVCFGDNSTCAGCDGVPNSGKKFDVLGVCGGNATRIPCGPECVITGLSTGTAILCSGCCLILLLVTVPACLRAWKSLRAGGSTIVDGVAFSEAPLPTSVQQQQHLQQQVWLLPPPTGGAWPERVRDRRLRVGSGPPV